MDAPTLADLQRILDNITISRSCKIKTAVKQLAGGTAIPELLIWEWLRETSRPDRNLLQRIQTWAQANNYDSEHLNLFGTKTKQNEQQKEKKDPSI